MRRIPLALAIAAFAPFAQAEVKESAADAFFLTFTGTVAAPTAKAYDDIVHVARWWNSEHTYSGRAVNLSIRAEAGGCFCEKWKDGSAEHGEVLMAIPGRMLRLRAALGPLQERALTGILTFWLSNDDSTTTLTVEYRVNGANASGLDQLAPSVDQMLGDQVERLRRYIATGSPEPPPEEKAAAAAAAAVAEKAAADAEIEARIRALKAEIESHGAATPARAGGAPRPAQRAPKNETPQPPRP
jgi:uncharacterized protein YndB with AHSA1/START domain